MPGNDLNTRDDNWQELLNLEDDKVRTLTDGDTEVAIFDDWIDKNEDKIDYMRFKLEEPTKLFFTVNADTTAKYTIYRYADGTLESISTGSLSKAKKKKVKDEDGDWYWEYPEKNYSATTKAFLLTSGDYFISVQAKDKTVDSRYNVYLEDNSIFFGVKSEPEDNNWLTIHQNADPDNEYNLGVISAPIYDVLAEGWVGCGDDIAYRKFTLEKKAALSFRVSSSDSTRFTLWMLNTDTQTLEKVFSVKPEEKKGGEYNLYVKTECRALAQGTYFFSVESTNAAKGGSADYIVYLASDSMFPGPHCNNDDDKLEDVQSNDAYRLGSPNSFSNWSFRDWVGFGDESDYRVFTLDRAARLSFTALADDLVKFTIFQLATDKRGNTYRKNILSISPEKHSSKYEDWIYAAAAKGKLFEKGEYYICVKSRNASKGGNAEYSLEIDKEKSSFFGNENGSVDDWRDYKEVGAASKQLVAAGPLQADKKIISGWVGYGDPYDYYKFSLAGKAKLKFQINACDPVKFTIYKLVGSLGSYSLKKVQTVTTPKSPKQYDSADNEWVDPEWDYSKKTTAIQLAKGEYYICVQSTTAAKGGDAYYEVTLDEKSMFYGEAGTVYGTVYGPDQKAPDDGWNNSLSKDEKNEYGDPVKNTDVTDSSILVKEDMEEIVVDKDVSFEYNGTVFHNFVGQGDASDYAAIVLTVKTQLSLSIDSTDAARFSIGMLGFDRDKNDYCLNSFYSAELLPDPETGGFHLTMPGIMLNADEQYFISMESLNPDAGGSAYYNISVNQDDCVFARNNADHSNDWDDLATNGADSSLFCDLGAFDEDKGMMLTGWVGYDDPVDYYKISIEDKGHLYNCLKAELHYSDKLFLKIYKLEENEGEYKLVSVPENRKSIPNLPPTQQRKGGPYTEELSWGNYTRSLTPGDYYIAVSGKGNGNDYTVFLYTGAAPKVSALAMPETASAASSLAMPETSDALAMSDDLSFAQYADADVLADPSGTFLADLNGISACQDLATLA